MVERLLREQEVAGSNPVVSILYTINGCGVFDRSFFLFKNKMSTYYNHSRLKSIGLIFVVSLSPLFSFVKCSLLNER